MQSRNKKDMTIAERCHVMRACSVAGCGRVYLARGYCQNHYMQLRRAGDPLVAPRIPESQQTYIRRRVAVTSSGCWDWQLSKFNGYGRAGRGGGNQRPAHAVAWEAWNGPVPDGRQINHRCHNRACCNPDHLYAGTQRENVADMYAAGRANPLRGETNGMSRLTVADVQSIRSSREPARVLRERFGVSDTLIRAVRKRLCWAHVP